MKDKHRLEFEGGMRIVSVFKTTDKPVPAPKVERFLHEMKMCDVAETVIPMMHQCYRRGFRRGFLIAMLAAILGHILSPWLTRFFE